MPAQVGAHEDLVLLDDQPEHADDGSLGLGREEAPLLAGDPVEQRQIVGVRGRMRDEAVAGDRRLVDVEGADEPDDRLAIRGESRPDPDRPAHEAVRSTASRKARTGPRPPALEHAHMVDARQRHEALRPGRGREQALAERDRDHPVAVAMDDEERAFELVDAVDRAVLIAQQPHRQVPVVVPCHIRRRGERRVEDEPGDRLLGREPHGDAGAERLAVEHEPLGRRPGGKPRVGGAGIDPQARLARRAGRARIAAIADDQEPAPALGQELRAVAPVQEAAAVAVEIEEGGAPGRGGLVPADDALAVFGRQRHILEVGQAGLARADLLAPGRIEQRALSQIEEGDDRGVERRARRG